MDRNNGTTYERLAEKVALRKESVDRNAAAWAALKEAFCRSPQGERG